MSETQKDARAECVQDWLWPKGGWREWGWYGRWGPSCSPVGYAEEFWLCSAGSRWYIGAVKWRTCYFRKACLAADGELQGDRPEAVRSSRRLLLITLWLRGDNAWTRKGQRDHRRGQLTGGSISEENLSGLGTDWMWEWRRCDVTWASGNGAQKLLVYLSWFFYSIDININVNKGFTVFEVLFNVIIYLKFFFLILQVIYGPGSFMSTPFQQLLLWRWRLFSVMVRFIYPTTFTYKI